jgi:hypothetical protein
VEEELILVKHGLCVNGLASLGDERCNPVAACLEPSEGDIYIKCNCKSFE